MCSQFGAADTSERGSDRLQSTRSLRHNTTGSDQWRAVQPSTAVVFARDRRHGCRAHSYSWVEGRRPEAGGFGERWLRAVADGGGRSEGSSSQACRVCARCAHLAARSRLCNLVFHTGTPSFLTFHRANPTPASLMYCILTRTSGAPPPVIPFATHLAAQLTAEISRRSWGLCDAQIGDLPFPTSAPGADGLSAPTSSQGADGLWATCWGERNPLQAECAQPVDRVVEGPLDSSVTEAAIARSSMMQLPAPPPAATQGARFRVDARMRSLLREWRWRSSARS